ncbi:YheC/YheD family protein [Paenibacillus sp. JX-17]|uniref:YheC/YheD family protein n=1 Tax=Paenibacillus lacisoli TaxID=3064525 RepID=A0ABT9CA58_9BACL|nr:YheC/YheD family protein [Paenibacillus sp. JX-17]MDO7906127.1 YheC/YheD family protein [Paenibacillus sp. JX-17]
MNRMPLSRIGMLGVLTGAGRNDEPAAEPHFCGKLLEYGPRYGLQVVILTPAGIASPSGGITGWQLVNREWQSISCELPDLIYDRCLVPGGAEARRQLARLFSLQAKPLRYWGQPLPGKWLVHTALQQDSRLRPHLPPTVLYGGPDQLQSRLLPSRNGIILKPVGGMQGKGVLHIRPESSGSSFAIRGRTRLNEPFSRTFPAVEAATAWLHRWIGRRPYLVQPYLQLTTSGGQPYDIRALLQKNGRGRWTVTGLAAREGSAEGLTSNLHGGGRASPAHAYLQAQHGLAHAEEACRQIEQLALEAAARLEAQFGRLGELGVDFGVGLADRHLWILEVNSKPGRTSFYTAGTPAQAEQSITRPLAYARYLLLRSPGRIWHDRTAL